MRFQHHIYQYANAMQVQMVPKIVVETQAEGTPLRATECLEGAGGPTCKSGLKNYVATEVVTGAITELCNQSVQTVIIR